MSDSPVLPTRLGITAVGAGQTPDAPDAWLTKGLTKGRLHEFYADEAQDSTAVVGFSIALALAGGTAPILWVRKEEDERRAGRLHANGLAEFGLSPDQLILVIAADEAGLLRVAADAARCPGLGALVVESRGRAPGLDLTATRRLMLATEASDVTALCIRIGAEPTPSAAATRWSIAAAPSTSLDADAPGQPAFDVELLRQRGGPAGRRWRVEWNRDERCFSPLPGAGLPLAADRPVALDPPAPVRRTG